MKKNFNHRRRRRYGIAVAMAGCLAVLSCTRFPTSLGYIGDQYVQTVGFVFTPLAEGAPGDSIRLHAYFAGQPVRTYACSISTQFTVTQYGSDTAVNFRQVVDPNALSGPDSISLSFVIPQDFFAWASPLILSALDSIPDSLKALYGLDTAAIRRVPPSQLPALAGLFLTTTDFSTVDSLTCKKIAHLSEILSGQIVLHLAVNGGYTITRNITVRYNSHIRNNRYIFVNKNPDAQWIAIFKMKPRTKLFYSPADRNDGDTIFCLYAKDTSVIAGPKRFTDTVVIDTGFAYFVVGDSGIINGIDHRDSVYTNEGAFIAEDFSYLWFYQPDTTGNGDLNPENSLSISNGRGYYGSIAPPLDTAIHDIAIWARVLESASGVLNAPTSTSVRQVHVVFTYTPRYAATVKKK
jgi:hypothetical protein